MTAYLPRAYLSICGRTVDYGVIVELDPMCPDIAGCVNHGLLLAPDADGNYPEPPAPRRSCCGG